jgi:hypothetical protein
MSTRYIAAIITERGIARLPFASSFEGFSEGR